MSILIISDLHLEQANPNIADIFFRFLNHEARQAEALYILGDFFEAWIGDDDLTPFNLSVIKALHDAHESGLPIFFMHGNRDFLIGKKFLRASGCTLLPEEYVLDIYDTPTLLMHGDTLCTHDVKYLKFRKRIRKWWVQQLFLMKSLKKRQEIAANYRANSKSHVATLPDYIMDVTQEEVERVMKKNQVQHLIHGHTHRQAVHQFNLNDQPATRTVLGAWHEYGVALVCEKSGKQEFLVLK